MTASIALSTLSFSSVYAGGDLMKFYRKVGEALTKPDHTKSDHPVVKKMAIRPGVFIDTQEVEKPQGLSSVLSQDLVDTLSKSIKKKIFHRKKYHLANLEQFQSQQCLLNRSELEVIDLETVKDILNVQQNEYMHLKMAKLFAAKSPNYSLPQNDKEHPYAFQQAITQIRTFLSNPEKVIQRMKELQREVLLLKKAHPDVDAQIPLQEVLARWEKHFGFNPAIVLEPKILTAKEWREMLQSGSLFYDLYWEPRWYEPHGAETHRLQWHLIMRDAYDHLADYGLDNIQQLVDIYKNMGSSEVSKSLVWHPKVKKFERSLWYQTVDTEDINFTGPVLTRWTVKKLEGLKESK